MIDRSAVPVMAAPLDPFSHQLQHQLNGNKNGTPDSNSNATPWGTWEELLLGSAVLKHGANNWALVSQELQPRASSSSFFTPEACRAGYHAIQLRFGADAGREGGSLQWYEELRRLRVAHLKRELEQYDSSIGSLEIKIKRLQSEEQEIGKAQISRAEPGGNKFNEAPGEPAIKVSTHTDDSKDSRAFLTMQSGQDDADDSSSPQEISLNAPTVPLRRTIDQISDVAWQAARASKKHSHGVKKGLHDGFTSTLIQNHEAEKAHTCAKHKQDELPTLNSDVFVKAGEAPEANTSFKLGVLPTLKSVNIEESTKSTKSPHVRDDDDASRHSDSESQSLCSPRMSKSQPAKRRQNIDGSGTGLAGEGCGQDDVDYKRHVQKALGEKHFAHTKSIRPVESAGSTEGKVEQALAVKLFKPRALTARIKKEMMSCKEEDQTLSQSSIGRDEEDCLRQVVVAATNTGEKVQSTSSAENFLHCDVWGESAEVRTREFRPTSKRQRLMGKVDWKRKKAVDTDDLRDLINVTAHALSVKTESLTSSHESSESMQSSGGKERLDREGWNHSERFSGDSQYEKSERSSCVDGNEDLSPMSRRHRRERKVSGKLIPLLESLRAICAHKCGYFFRHSHEPENDMYCQIVRVPVDLGTIRTRLEEGQYTSSMLFFRDLLLMVSNAIVYYPKDTLESAAALGLRDCVLKEMEHVFETEALVKREGPSFRKRDSKQVLGQGRRKGGFKVFSMDRTSRKRDCMLKLPDASATESRWSHQSFVSRFVEGVQGADRRLVGKRSINLAIDVHNVAESLDAKNALSDKGITELSGSIKNEAFLLAKANEMKERIGATPGKVHDMDTVSDRSPLLTAKVHAFQGGFSENCTEKKAGFWSVGSIGKPSVLTPHKRKEIGILNSKVAPANGQEPVKRRVGRPPKHAHQGLQKARNVVETSISTRKRYRR